jgi:hypothetical protein
MANLRRDLANANMDQYLEVTPPDAEYSVISLKISRFCGQVVNGAEAGREGFGDAR